MNSSSRAAVATAAMAALRRPGSPHLPALATIAAGMLLPSLLVLAYILVRNDGHFAYALAAPYTHLALAEQIAQGHYGLNPGEPSSPSSSILWPFLLAGLSFLRLGEYSALLACLVANLASGGLLYALGLECGIRLDRLRLPYLAAITVSLTLALNLIGLAFAGLEHSLHVTLTLASLLGLVRFVRSGRADPWWLASIALLPLVRFEAAAALAADILVLLVFRKYRHALGVALAGVAAIGGFALYLHSLGLPYLPNSVLARSEVASTGLDLAEAGAGPAALVRALYSSFRVNLLAYGATHILGMLVALAWGVSRAARLPRQGRARWAEVTAFGFFAVVALAQLTGGSLSSFSRYEIYVLALGVGALMVVFAAEADAFLARLRPASCAAFCLAVLLLFAGYALRTVDSISAAGNSHDQQYQLLRYVTEFYRRPVAIDHPGRIFPRQQTRPEHDFRVGGVGAARDSGNYHRSVFQVEGHAVLDMSRGACLRRVDRGSKVLFPVSLSVGQRDPVLWPFRPRNGRDHIAKVQRERVREHGVWRGIGSEQSLGLAIALHEGYQRVLPPGEPQIVERLSVDREEPHGRAVFGRHIGDGCADSEGQCGEARTVELHKFSDHAPLAQHLRHAQDEVGAGRAFGQPAGQLEADDLGDQHRDRLTEHRGLRLDAANSPAEHSEAVDHRRVRVGADQRVGVGERLAAFLFFEDDGGQVLEVHLVDDARPGGDHPEVVEGLLAPAQELVALAVPFEFDLHVLRECAGGAEVIDLHRVVDDEVNTLQWVNPARVAAERLDCLAHRGEVHHNGHARKVLEQHPCRGERDLAIGPAVGLPGCERLDVFTRDGPAVLQPEEVLEQDLQREWQPVEMADALRAERFEREVGVGAADGR